MPVSKKDPDVLAFAKERRAAGLSLEQIAAELTQLETPVTAMTLSRWLAEPGAPKEQRTKRKAPAQRPGDRKPPSAPPPAAEDAPIDTLATMRRTLARTLQDVEAQRIVNPKLAQQLGRDAATYAAIVARLERGQADDADTLSFSRKEIDQAIPALLEKMAGWVDRCRAAGGLLCARCSRELSVELGRPGDPPAPPAP
jgi:hypothetical protein